MDNRRLFKGQIASGKSGKREYTSLLEVDEMVNVSLQIPQISYSGFVCVAADGSCKGGGVWKLGWD